MTIAGGDPIFPELADARLAKDRIVDPQEVVRRDPEIIFASWCGKKVNFDRIRKRPGWDAVTAVRCNRIHEIKSTYILQPGPASLTEGIRQLHDAMATVRSLAAGVRTSPKAVGLGYVSDEQRLCRARNRRLCGDTLEQQFRQRACRLPPGLPNRRSRTA